MKSDTIENLEGKVWPAPNFQSNLVLTAHALRKKPIDELTTNDLRVAFKEDVGAIFLKKRVLEVLAEEPAIGEMFDGDLILAVMHSRQYCEDLTFRKNVTALANLALQQDLDLQTRKEVENLLETI